MTRETLQPSTQASRGLSMREAVIISGKSEATLRRLISQKDVHAHKDGDGRYVIDETSLRHYLVTKAQLSLATVPVARHGASLRPRGGSADALNGEGINGEVIQALRDLIGQLRDDLERERRRADSLEARLVASEIEKTQHLAEMRAMLSKDLSGKEGVLSRWIRR